MSGVQILRSRIVSMMLAGLIFISCGRKEPGNIFYVQNTISGFQNAPVTPAARAALVKEAGFDGLEGMGFDGFHELKKALDEAGLLMPVNYVGLKLEGPGLESEEGLMEQVKEMAASMDKGSVIYFFVTSKTYDKPCETGDSLLALILSEYADIAAVTGVKMCIYPHVNTYCETLGHSVRISKMVNKKNFGAALNLCHLLKVEGEDGMEDKLQEYTRYLFAVNICGADKGDTRNFGWDRLIQPLGEGTFDTYRFVKLLWDNGYEGPFGLQCYNLRGEARTTLAGSMSAWKSFRKKYAEEK